MQIVDNIQPLPDPKSPINIEASQNSQHPEFHVNFGKVLATILFGLQVWGASKNSPTAFFTNPQNDAQIINGIASVWVTK